MANLETEHLEDRLLLSVAPLPDDVGDTFADAAEVTLRPNGLARRLAGLQHDGDADVFSFQAPHTGRLQVEQRPLPGSNFVGFIELFDGQGQPLTPERFLRSGRNTIVGFTVEAGRDYFVKARATPPASPPVPLPDDSAFLASDTPLGQGNFELFFGPADDVGNGAADATPLPTVSGLVTGRIEVPSDVDRFVFVAPASGRLHVQYQAIEADPGTLTLLDAGEQSLISASGTNAPLALDVIAGETYYLEMKGPATWSADSWPGYAVAFFLVPSQPSAGPTGGSTGSDSTEGVGSPSPNGFSSFFAFIDLNRFLNTPRPATASVAGLTAEASGQALVGTLLGGQANSSFEPMTPAYFSGGGESPGEEKSAETPTDLPADVMVLNFKMGVTDALANQVSEVKQRWVEGEPSAAPTDSGVAVLPWMLAEELVRLGRPVSDTAMSLLQQLVEMGQTVLPSEPATEWVKDEPPPEPPTPRAQEQTQRDLRGQMRTLMSLLLALAAAQLWWTSRDDRSRRRPDLDKEPTVNGDEPLLRRSGAL